MGLRKKQSSLSEISLGDVAYRYIDAMFGLFGQLYLIAFSAIYYAVQYEFLVHLGIGQQELLTYLSLLSVVVLLVSRYSRWTFPVLIEDSLLVAFVWILLGNLLHAGNDTCICCAEATACFWQYNQIFFSFLCVALMFLSFLFDARHYVAAILFKTAAILLLLLVPIVPITCNQFLFNELGISLLKLLLFVVIWFVQRRLRLMEKALANEYLKTIALLRSYAQYRLLFEGTTTTTEEEDDDLSIPVNLFRHLDELLWRVDEYKKKRRRHGARRAGGGGEQDCEFDIQLGALFKVYDIHKDTGEQRGFFSWKNRHYDNTLLFVLDLSSTIWILTICPLFLFFVAVQFLLLFYNLSRTLQELRAVDKNVKFMEAVQDRRLSRRPV